MNLADQIRADREAGKRTAKMNRAFQRRVQRLVELEEIALVVEEMLAARDAGRVDKSYVPEAARRISNALARLRKALEQVNDG